MNYHFPCAPKFPLILHILNAHLLITTFFFLFLSFIIDCANVMTVLFLETKKIYIIILQTSNLIWLPLHYYACRHRVRRINKIVNIIIRSFEISFHINRNCLSNDHIENSFANLKEIMILNFEDIQNSTFNNFY